MFSRSRPAARWLAPAVLARRAKKWAPVFGKSDAPSKNRSGRCDAFFTLFALALAATMMAGCSDKPVPPCPEVRVDRDTEQLVKFADAGRQDRTDVDYGVEIVGYQGVCKYKNRKIKSKDKHSHEVTVRREVQVTMSVTMDLVRGPAAKERRVSIPYFVALPDFFPKAAGKRTFTVTRELPSRPGAHEKIVEKDLHVTIPLRGDEPGAAYEVYVGFQLTPDEVAFNRSQHPGAATE